MTAFGLNGATLAFVLKAAAMESYLEPKSSADLNYVQRYPVESVMTYTSVILAVQPILNAHVRDQII